MMGWMVCYQVTRAPVVTQSKGASYHKYQEGTVPLEAEEKPLQGKVTLYKKLDTPHLFALLSPFSSFCPRASTTTKGNLTQCPCANALIFPSKAKLFCPTAMLRTPQYLAAIDLDDITPLSSPSPPPTLARSLIPKPALYIPQPLHLARSLCLSLCSVPRSHVIRVLGPSFASSPLFIFPTILGPCEQHLSSHGYGRLAVGQ